MAIRNVFEHVMEVAQTIDNIEIDDLKQEMAANGDLLLLDIREIQELVDKGTLPGATTCTPWHAGILGQPRQPLCSRLFRRRQAHGDLLRWRWPLGLRSKIAGGNGFYQCRQPCGWFWRMGKSR